MSAIIFQNVSKQYGSLASALHTVSFKVEAGEFTVLSGPSGSGKTTILNLAAGLDRPSNGSIFMLGYELTDMRSSDVSALRRQAVGFVFQSYNLFPVLTALENVEYPLALRGLDSGERRDRAAEALREVGMGDLLHRAPSELSGGQQQRVAVARAIVTQPKIVFADEPTANLDSKTSAKLLELFQELNQRHQITFLFSSHDPSVLKASSRVIEVFDGRIKGDSVP